MNLFQKIVSVFKPKDYGRIIFLLFLMIAGAFVETIGIGIVMPIINVVSNPSVIGTSKFYGAAYEFLGSANVQDFVFKSSALLIIFLIAKNLFLTYASFYQSYFTAEKEAEVSEGLLRSYLSMPYEKFIARNSSNLLLNINQETSQLFTNVISSFLALVSEAFVALAMVAVLLVIYPVATLMAAGLAFLASIAFSLAIKKRLTRLGEQRIEARERMLECATQGLYGLKELVVAGRSEYFIKLFENRAAQMADAQGFSEAMSRVPRLYIETVAILILLAVVVYFMALGDNLIQALSLFGLVTFRVLPSVNRISVSATRVRFYMPSLDAVVSDLKAFEASSDSVVIPLPFNREFGIENVAYAYASTGNRILKGASLCVRKGEIVSIIGPSGSGKSTLLDIMLGLIEPQEGRVTVDGKPIRENLAGWRQNLSYLPQFVYLVNGSIRANVAFGLDDKDVDEAKVRAALEKAELMDYVNSLPQGLDTPIGDISGKLSGGQRQRIGIARALYHSRSILFLDEATSGLDPATEAKICETLKALTPQVTVVSVSHQQALINIADKIYQLENGALVLFS